MPIFVFLRLANSSINSDKQTNKQKTKNPSILTYEMYATDINIENLLTQLQMMPDVVGQQTKIIRWAFIRLLP